VYQNFQSIEIEAPDLTLILAGDHIYKMDYGEMLDWHRTHGAEITIATFQVPPSAAGRYGVMDIAEDYQVTGFEEKPQHDHPARSRFDASMVSASMGIYVFNTSVLLRALHEDSHTQSSSHDFAKDVIPSLLARCRVVAYDFRDLNAKQSRYWRDVGTLDAYYEANMDLVSVTPEFNLYDQRWPIRTRATQQPPAKFVFAQKGRRMGLALDSIVSAGCIVSGGRVLHSVLSPGVRVNSYCEVEYSILMPNVEIGRYTRLRRAIVNTGVKVPELQSIGFDPEADRTSGHHVTEGGVTVVG
jgi:glucose-1-phosphate adenylyltransferase